MNNMVLYVVGVMLNLHKLMSEVTHCHALSDRKGAIGLGLGLHASFAAYLVWESHHMGSFNQYRHDSMKEAASHLHGNISTYLFIIASSSFRTTWTR